MPSAWGGLSIVIALGCGRAGPPAGTGGPGTKGAIDSEPQSADSEARTDTAEVDSGASDSGSDSVPCAPSERDSCVGDTGVCNGCPMTAPERACDTPISFTPPMHEAEARYQLPSQMDCREENQTSDGDRLLDCADTVLQWPTSPMLFGSQWIGDLDGDGTKDLVFARSDDDSATTAALVYADRRLDSGDLGDVADAEGMATFVPTAPAGDIDADGIDDFFVGVLSNGTGYPVTGIGLGSRRVRSAGSSLTWQQPEKYWTGDLAVGWYSLGLGNNQSVPSSVAAGDVTGDGIPDVIASETPPDDATYSRVSVLRGGTEIQRSGAISGLAEWHFQERWRVGEGYNVVHGTPVGDLDGDGADELGLVDSPDEYLGTHVGTGWRVGLTSMRDLAPCDYDVDDIMSAALVVPDTSALGTALTTPTWPGTLFALRGARDLNGDGRSDLVVGGSVSTDDGAQPVLWLLYGGESWITGGGLLAGNIDRVEFAYVPNAGWDRGYSPDFERLALPDLDGNTIDDIVVGGAPFSSADSFQSWVTIIPGEVGGIRGVHVPTDSTFDAIVGANRHFLTPSRENGDLDADGFEDLVLMGDELTYGANSLTAYIFYGGAFP